MTFVSSVAESAAKLLDLHAVAKMLDCSFRHVYRLSEAGRMPGPVRLGALVRWSKSAIEDWISQGCPIVGEMKNRPCTKEVMSNDD